jgi:hypothetical protein
MVKTCCAGGIQRERGSNINQSRKWTNPVLQWVRLEELCVQQDAEGGECQSLEEEWDG